MSNDIGTCGCGGITFSLDAAALNLINCHCDMCRDHNGSAYSTYVIYPADALTILTGQESVTRYATGDSEKNFCRSCGTPLFNRHKKHSDICLVYLGALRSQDHMKPKVNVWCENKLAWVDEISAIHSLQQG